MEKTIQVNLTQEQVIALERAITKQGESINWVLKNKNNDAKTIAFLKKRLVTLREIYSQIIEHVPKKGISK